MSGYSPILELGDDPHPLTPREKVAQIVRDGMSRLAASQAGARPVVSASKEADRVTDAILTALASGSGDHAPVAWRVKDFADGWIVCGSEQTAVDLAAAMSGATVQSLYGPALLAENAALRADLAKTGRDFSELRDSYDRVSNKLCVERAHGGRETKRATEAERKLAEAVQIMKPFARIADEEGGYREDDRLAWGLNRCDISWGDLRAVRTFLSKEAERG